MKYTAEHNGFILNIEEVQEEGKDICFLGKCEELEFTNRQLYHSGFWRLVAKFQHEVDNRIIEDKEKELDEKLKKAVEDFRIPWRL